jgi:hypothetical protein
MTRSKLKLQKEAGYMNATGYHHQTRNLAHGAGSIHEPPKLDSLGGSNWTGLRTYRRIRSWPGIAASVSNSDPGGARLSRRSGRDARIGAQAQSVTEPDPALGAEVRGRGTHRRSSRRRPHRGVRGKIAELERKVGQLTMEVDLLKKGVQLGRQRSVVTSSIVSGPKASPSREDAA